MIAEGADADDIGNGIGRFGSKPLSTLTFGITTGAGLLTVFATGASSSQVNILSSPYFLCCLSLINNFTSYWQASHSSKPASPGRIVQAGPSASAATTAAAAAAAARVGSPFDTEFNEPFFTVDFST
jgi:hypothetical protein